MPSAPPDQPPAREPAPHAAPAASARGAAEIAAELRRAFERAMHASHGRAAAQDVVLAAYMDAAAENLARVYEEAEQLFSDAVFDDLVAALAVPPRSAHPAQTVVAFTGAAGDEFITPDTPLTGTSGRGEPLPFRVVVPVRVAPARLALAAVVENGRVTLVPGATLPGGGATAEPVPPVAGPAPLRADHAPHAPTLFLAFDLEPPDAGDPGASGPRDAGAGEAAADGHLSGFGLFVDVAQPDHPVARALGANVWQLLDDGGDAGGVAREPLVLRARPGPGGTRLLQWADAPRPREGDDAESADAVASWAAHGVYGPLCWRWPEVPPGRRARSHPPRALAAVLPELLGPELAARYARPLVWVQVALPAEAGGVAESVRRVVLHAAPASNVEALATVVGVGELGEAGVFYAEAPPGRHLLTVLGVAGEQGAAYRRTSDAAGGLARGEYRVHHDMVELRPARGPTGRFDHAVLVRLLFTDGARANGLQPGDVVGRGSRVGRVGFGAASVMPARGGTAPPEHGPARVRFADVVRTRERLVTPADVDVALRAFEPRIREARVRDALEVAPGGVPRRVTVVTAEVRAADFADPSAELSVLAGVLERHLQARAAPSVRVRVEVPDPRRAPAGAPGARRVRDAAAAPVRPPEQAIPERTPGGTAAMPDFVRPRRGARHTVDTALRALRALGVDDARIALESAGPGWPEGDVVRQHPAPGAALRGERGPDARVVLSVAGPGALDALPYALRDVAGDGEDDAGFGVDALMALFDSPTRKLRHHLRAGGEFFALRADDLLAARRWIEHVYQVDPAPWAPARWPALARFLASLHRVAGREEGFATGLRVLFDLPLASLAVEAAVVPTASDGRATLGRHALRLGADTLLGVGQHAAARLAVTLGPVPLGAYHAGTDPAAEAERRALYALLAPASLATEVRERWIVGDPAAGARLGADATALGLTARLGAAPAGAPTADGGREGDAPRS